MLERNEKYGENFEKPLSEDQINKVDSRTIGQRYKSGVAIGVEKVWYGEHGKDGRLAPKPKLGTPEESTSKPGTSVSTSESETTSLEKSKVEIPKVPLSGELTTGPKLEKTGQDVDDGLTIHTPPEEGVESPQTKSVRDELGVSTPKKSEQELSQDKGKSVRDSVQNELGSNKPTTGPKHGVQ